jgi:AcrR family transcriptional regulator
MDKKLLKQGRIRGYFVDAACEIIEAEGLSEASVRKVSEKAGYHYTTLYAHFSDFNHVIHLAILKFLTRAMDFMESKINGVDGPLRRYKMAWLAYVEYMIDHPNIARVVLLERVMDVSEDLLELMAQNPLIRGQKEFLAKCIDAGELAPEEARDISGMISYICSGCISNFLSGRHGRNREECLDLCSKTMERILRTESGVKGTCLK